MKSSRCLSPPRALSQPSDSTPTLQLDSVDVQFAVQARQGWRAKLLRALQGVSLELSSGEALGIVGESGSGKSTLARAALHLLRANTGRIAWLGEPLPGLAPSRLRQLRRDVQIIFQDPLASLDPRMRISAQLSEPLGVHRPELSGSGRSRVVAEALEQVGLASSLLQRYPHELSGGQCQRVGIARALVLEPRVLVCDEAVSALDVTVQEQIIELLDGLKRERGMSILFISHNLAVVRRLCDRILVLYLGRMMELAPVRAIYAHPRHPYTRELLDSAPIADPDVQPQRLQRVRAGEAPSPFEPPSGCVYRTRCAYAIQECGTQQPLWESTPEQGQVACIRWRELALEIP